MAPVTARSRPHARRAAWTQRGAGDPALGDDGGPSTAARGGHDDLRAAWRGGKRHVNEQRVRELIRLSLHLLPGMQLPDGSFCLEARKGAEQPSGRSARYTLMT